jgi:hypothetical protein
MWSSGALIARRLVADRNIEEVSVPRSIFWLARREPVVVTPGTTSGPSARAPSRTSGSGAMCSRGYRVLVLVPLTGNMRPPRPAPAQAVSIVASPGSARVGEGRDHVALPAAEGS